MKPTSQFLVYALIDPRSGEVRYIGKSSCGLKRPKHHWTHKSLRESSDHCHNWVRSVLKQRSTPEVEVLEEACAELLNEAEVFWIGYFKMIGANLTNQTPGGDGWSGPVPLEIRAKISATRRRGNYVSWTKLHGHSEETRKKIGEAGRRRKHSLETRMKMSHARKGHLVSPETRAKISASKLGRKRK
jgi:hypothetical protein